MTDRLTRRHVLAGLLSGVGSAAIAEAPVLSGRPRPRGIVPQAVIAATQSDTLVQKAKLGGEVAFAVADAKTGAFLEMRGGTRAMPPASTLKAVTALYAMDRLGTDFRFRTEIIATGPLINGRVEGDLVLAGGGDPTLDTDRMAELAVGLREAGVVEVAGKFLIWPGALPRGDRIDDEQPEVVSYNPAYGGLNLNYNRVHFQWERKQNDYQITMHARARKFSPSTSVASMAIVDRKSPVFDYANSVHRDRWSVSRGALGKDGARWLPVRFPAWYAGDVFRTLARSNGIVLGPAELVESRPSGSVLAVVESNTLAPVMQDMLKYSTNLTAEASGLSASRTGDSPVTSLVQSGAEMARWATARFGATGLIFKDHSGLGYDSAVPPVGMVRILSANRQLAPLLKTVNLSLDKKRPAPDGVEVRAKTGTLNFVSSLAGFVTSPSGRELCFAIMTADTERRDAIPVAERERPPGAKSWSRRSRQLQKELIRGWVKAFPA